MRPVIALVVVAACGGASGSPGRLRFHNADPVVLVNDRKPIAAPEKFDT